MGGIEMVISSSTYFRQRKEEVNLKLMLTIQFVLFTELSSNYLEIEDNFCSDAIGGGKKRPQNRYQNHYSEQVLSCFWFYYTFHVVWKESKI